MATWFVKGLSNITGVSVQTLHHYDRIGLLKPSIRQPNGYRLYSEKDLMRLQQIIALKFFGFELSQIATLLAGNDDILEHFATQAKFLKEKANALNNASQTLTSIISDCKDHKSVPWEEVIKSIEVYHMTQQLEQTWVANVFTTDELKQYAQFDADLKNRFTPAEKNAWEAAWQNIIQELKDSLNIDPKSPKGLDLAHKTMDLINNLYGKEHANLKHTIWNKGFKQGHGSDEHAFTPEVIAWLDKALDNFYRSRIYAILNQVETHSSDSVLEKFDELLAEMYGNAEELKQDLVNVALEDDHVSSKAREWLRRHYC